MNTKVSKLISSGLQLNSQNWSNHMNTKTLFVNYKSPENIDYKCILGLQVQMKEAWQCYSNYIYCKDIFTNINESSYHEFNPCPKESLPRAQRLIQFCDITNCKPIKSNEEISLTHGNIKRISSCDHTTYWYGPGLEPLILTEPYSPSATEIQNEITAKKLAAIILPAPGIYAGGNNYTHSVLMGMPQHIELLKSIENKFKQFENLSTYKWKDNSFKEAVDSIDSIFFFENELIGDYYD